MRPDLRSATRLLVAATDLLALEVRVVTGNRGPVLAVLQLLAFAVVAVSQRLRDDPWDTASFYGRALVLPSLVPMIVLGMGAVMGERDNRQLEVTFAAPGGRFQLWAFRMAALIVASLGATLVLSGLTWIFIDHDHPVLSAALHATVPLAFLAILTVFLSLVFNGAASAAFATSGVVALSWLLHQGGPNRFDLFFNPYVAPPDSLDPMTWFRTVVFNRSLLLFLTGLLFALSLWLLQRRERLL